MVNFIRKQNYNYGNNINVEYDINGFASTDFVKIGNQYEHKVVKLNFNLTPLINPFSIDELKFKLFFYDTNNTELSFDFNGFCFEIPRKITKKHGLYRFVVSIIKNNNILFTTAEIKAFVDKSNYNPEFDIRDEKNYTNIANAEMINCKLFPNHQLWLSNDRITSQSKLIFNDFEQFNDYYKFIIYTKNDKYYYSYVEDNTAFLPLQLVDDQGVWTASFIAFKGNINDMNNPNKDTDGNYRFFISNSYPITVGDTIIV